MSDERWALLNVVDKTGIVELAYDLSSMGYRILSSGATLAALRQAEVAVVDLRDWLESPNVLEGTLGLLHPKLLLGIAADRSDPESMRELESRGGSPVDLVAVNLYPISELPSEPGRAPAEMLEFLDVAGSTILRLAASNYRFVTALCDPSDYSGIVEAMRPPYKPTLNKRLALAGKAFHYAAYYDATVAQSLSGRLETLPDELVIALKKTVELGYGENPHQQGALYTRSGARPWGVNSAALVWGKSLSYNHYLDLDAAWELAGEIEDPACAIVKHAAPVGAAANERLPEAVRFAHQADPRGSHFATAAVNRPLDEETARHLAGYYLSVIAAPQFDPKAVDILKTNKDVRLVAVPSTLVSAYEMDLKAVAGGVLFQDKDNQTLGPQLKSAARRQAGELETRALKTAWHVAKHARTHAAVVCRGPRTIGIGSGQTSRLDAIKLALSKSRERHPIIEAGMPVVLASDGALSAEHVLAAAAAGVTAIIQPGGSSDDKDAVEAADERGLAMLFTGLRHFRH